MESNTDVERDDLTSNESRVTLRVNEFHEGGAQAYGWSSYQVRPIRAPSSIPVSTFSTDHIFIYPVKTQNPYFIRPSIPDLRDILVWKILRYRHRSKW